MAGFKSFMTGHGLPSVRKLVRLRSKCREKDCFGPIPVKKINGGKATERQIKYAANQRRKGKSALLIAQVPGAYGNRMQSFAAVERSMFYPGPEESQLSPHGRMALVLQTRRGHPAGMMYTAKRLRGYHVTSRRCACQVMQQNGRSRHPRQGPKDKSGCAMNACVPMPCGILTGTP